VVKSEWGLKRICLSCSVKFYDLQKTPIACPSCGTVLEITSATKVRKTKSEKAKNIIIDDTLLDDDDDNDSSEDEM